MPRPKYCDKIANARSDVCYSQPSSRKNVYEYTTITTISKFGQFFVALHPKVCNFHPTPLQMFNVQ